MNKLSNGKEPTLRNYRQLAVEKFGKSSAAVRFLDREISRKGNNAEAQLPEPEMMERLENVHNGGRVPRAEEIEVK